MSKVAIDRHRLRELEIAADLAANFVMAFAKASDGELAPLIPALQEALATYEARMAVSDAMGGK